MGCFSPRGCAPAYGRARCTGPDAASLTAALRQRDPGPKPSSTKCTTAKNFLGHHASEHVDAPGWQPAPAGPMSINLSKPLWRDSSENATGLVHAPEKFDSWLLAVVERFGGATVIGVALRGLWFDQSLPREANVSFGTSSGRPPSISDRSVCTSNERVRPTSSGIPPTTRPKGARLTIVNQVAS